MCCIISTTSSETILKVLLKNTSQTQTPGSGAATNQLSGRTTNTPATNHTHTQVEEGYLSRGNEKHKQPKCLYDLYGCDSGLHVGF